jgi:glycosyltransferase involved in cell wall biosynthesis
VLLMAGAGDQERKELERRTSEWELQDKLNLNGIRRDFPRLMRAADVLLFPSRQEELGIVAVEAQAAGLPMFASTVVPREAIVVPELVKSLPLSEPISRWVEALFEMISARREPAEISQNAVEASVLIANSARNLLRVYTETCRSKGCGA